MSKEKNDNKAQIFIGNSLNVSMIKIVENEVLPLGSNEHTFSFENIARKCTHQRISSCGYPYETVMLH